jgi:hypothetical protein
MDDDFLKQYDSCPICKKKLGPLLRQTARNRVEQIPCSPKCQEKALIQKFGCCKKAKILPCVCTYSFTCPIHGNTHIGTHD